MRGINLLPWRAHQREQEQKRVVLLLIGWIGVALICVLLVNSHAKSLVSNQLIRNTMLQKEIALMEDQIKKLKKVEEMKEQLLSRISLIQHVQSTRTFMVHLLNELIYVLPSTVYLTQVEEKNNTISVTGYAQSNTHVSMLMHNIEHNNWLHVPILGEIKRDKSAAAQKFKLRFMLAPKLQIESGNEFH